MPKARHSCSCLQVTLTDNCEVDFGKSRFCDPEIDPTPVNAGVFRGYFLDGELGGRTVRQEKGPFAEHIFVRPQTCVGEAVSRIEAATKYLFYDYSQSSASLTIIRSKMMLRYFFSVE